MNKTAVAEVRYTKSKELKYIVNPIVVGLNISYALKKAKIKQKELAEVLSLTPTAISYWTKGIRSPDIYQLRVISQMTGMSMEWFLEEHI